MWERKYIHALNIYAVAEEIFFYLQEKDLVAVLINLCKHQLSSILDCYEMLKLNVYLKEKKMLNLHWKEINRKSVK